MVLSLSIPGPPDLFGLTLLLLLGLAVYVSLISLMTACRLTRPPRRTYGWAVARGVPGDPSELDQPLASESWTFQSRGRDLPVWDVAGLDPEGPVIVVTHGWGSSRIGTLVRLPALAEVASRVVLWDMPGHGDAPGACELAFGEVDDLRALVSRIRDDRPLVLYGWSLGGEVTLRAVAGGLGADAVVLEGVYRTGLIPAWNVMKQAGYPVLVNAPAAMAIIGLRHGLRPGRRFEDITPLANNVAAPALVLHGSIDQTSPIEDGRAIADAMPNAEFIEIDSAGHNDIWSEEHAAPAREAVQELARRFRASSTRPA
ncbi:MAG: alpha/beta hydrolase [Planctomycetota bacterium]